MVFITYDLGKMDQAKTSLAVNLLGIHRFGNVPTIRVGELMRMTRHGELSVHMEDMSNLVFRAE
jgi:hypothetical protein